MLWAEVSDNGIAISYAHHASSNRVRPASFKYPIEKSHRQRAILWVAVLLDRAYGESQRNKRIKVLVNPFGGTGNAPNWYAQDIEPILAAARCVTNVETTQSQGHAVEIAEKLDIEAFDVIAACSGDGLPYEIFNGLAKKRDASRALSKLAVVQLPCGSANALSWNLNGTDRPSLAALAVVKGVRTPLDLISITQGETRSLSFLSQSFGIIAESDLDTDHLRWMGSARFTYGYLLRLFRKVVYPCDIALKIEIGNKPQIREHYRNALDKQTPLVDKHNKVDSANLNLGLPPLRYGTINDPLPSGWVLVPYPTLGNFYCGNMPYMAPATNIFPASLPSDGFADLVTVDGAISRFSALRSMLAVGNGTFFDMPHVCYQKIAAYRIVPRVGENGCVSIDGERLPCLPWQAEVHRGLGTVLTRSGHVYEAEGVVQKQSYQC